MGNGIKDNVQVYNIPKFDGFHQRQQPPLISENIDEIEAFSRVRTLKLYQFLYDHLQNLEMSHRSR